MLVAVVSGDLAQSVTDIVAEVFTEEIDLDILSVYRPPEQEDEEEQARV